ncbi:PREDICTED: uncharacterized protein LOC108745491 [Trachymyrmex septentrionalis]|uniref:uncharacterized protein LOC108745491 n=1 Tax=Trachymyrmex septentrionalis TaxID=34720 RepID=UPI00084F5B93|nr:PREDICTED: uncharacterized protein LOC108745491 [Trachymyrmex septentrionalis]
MAYLLNKTSILWRPVFHKNIISGPINKNTLVRSHEYLTNKTNAWAEQKYKLKDNISNGYRLVYREQSNLCTLITSTYHFGWLSLAASLFILGYFILKPPVQEEVENTLSDDQLILRPSSNLERLLLIFGSCTLAIIFIVGSKTIPFRIYYNSVDKIYKAVFVNRILGKTQMETFGEGTAVPAFNRKNRNGIFFKINGRIILLDKECFPVQSIRERMICKTE